MKLTDIIKAAAGRMVKVTVALDRGMGTVEISAEGHDAIFMQGGEADEFIAAVDKLYEDSGDVTEDEAALCQAEQYAENIWS